jgi:hypothetical protein
LEGAFSRGNVAYKNKILARQPAKSMPDKISLAYVTQSSSPLAAPKYFAALKPVRHMNLINKIGKSMATYRHDPRQLPVNQIKLTSIEPESAAVSTVVHDDVC